MSAVTPTAWIQRALENRDLPLPDARPLYRYRITDAEFAELKALLSESTGLGVGWAIRTLSWDAAFVIYAAEWWRREFAGKWGFEELFQSIGVDFRALSVGSRNDLIERGLNKWRREVRVKNYKRRFLGTIATEGGLPLYRLRESGGWLNQILQPTLRRHISKGFAIPSLIEAYSSVIPVSLQSEELSDVLEDVAEATVRLRSAYDLHSKEFPIRWLDENVIDWRDEFPLPIDDLAARTLLAGLIDTAASAKQEASEALPFELDRILTNADKAAPAIIAELELPSFITLKQISMNEAAQSAPSVVDLDVVSDRDASVPWCRGVLTTLRGQRGYKLSGGVLKLKGKLATGHIEVRIRSFSETMTKVEVLNGDALDFDVPWTFTCQRGAWVLHGTASQSVQDDRALVYLPDEVVQVEGEAASDCTTIASLFNGTLCSLQGSVSLSRGGDSYLIKTGAQDGGISYFLSGRKLPLETSPNTVFVGAPRVVEHNRLSGQSRLLSQKSLLVRRQHGADLDPNRDDYNELSGVFRISVKDDSGHTLFSRKVGVLPQDFRYNICPSDSGPRAGRIEIANLECSEMIASSHGADCSVTTVGARHTIACNAEGTPPRSVEITALPIQQRDELKLTVPFPARGAILFDPQGHPISSGEFLTLSNLHGYRVRVFNDRSHFSKGFSVRLDLYDWAMDTAELKDIYIRKSLSGQGDFVELALSDWSQALQQLFAVSRSIDAFVRVTLNLSAEELIGIRVRRYKYSFELDHSQGLIALDSESAKSIPIDELDKLEVLTLPLAAPASEPLELEHQKSEGVPTAVWRFPAESLSPGPWMLYPAESAGLAVRPTLWNVTTMVEEPLADEPQLTLSEIAHIPDQDRRHELLYLALTGLANDFSDVGWTYLADLWAHTAHLPMACFDVWQISSRNPQFLAALLIRNQTDVLTALTGEFPVIWETVTLAAWTHVLGVYRKQLASQLGDDGAFIDELIDKAIERIGEQSQSMHSVRLIIGALVRGRRSPELSVMTLPVDKFVQPRISEEYQKLFQRQADNEWPELLSTKLTQHAEALPAVYTQIVRPHHGYQDAVFYLPVVLAWSVVHGGDESFTSSSDELFKIQQVKNFDEDWFDAAFQMFTGWLSQQEGLEEGIK